VYSVVDGVCRDAPLRGAQGAHVPGGCALVAGQSAHPEFVDAPGDLLLLALRQRAEQDEHSVGCPCRFFNDCTVGADDAADRRRLSVRVVRQQGFDGGLLVSPGQLAVDAVPHCEFGCDGGERLDAGRRVLDNLGGDDLWGWQ
jgi:hypothetical protein